MPAPQPRQQSTAPTTNAKPKPCGSPLRSQSACLATWGNTSLSSSLLFFSQCLRCKSHLVRWHRLLYPRRSSHEFQGKGQLSPGFASVIDLATQRRKHVQALQEISQNDRGRTDWHLQQEIKTERGGGPCFRRARSLPQVRPSRRRGPSAPARAASRRSPSLSPRAGTARSPRRRARSCPTCRPP